mmetsp:Transcript_26841/g.56888  ORF Transcript_26841/g.56888 Transcript_26841/m.56888 type:complete len:321 (+) Transcript_26841:1266-2228(+)
MLYPSTKVGVETFADDALEPEDEVAAAGGGGLLLLGGLHWELPCELVLVVDGPPQSSHQELWIDAVVRGAQQLHEVLPGDVAEVLTKGLRDFPTRWENRAISLLELEQHPVQPGEAAVSHLQTRVLFRWLKDVFVLFQETQAETSHYFLAHLCTEGIYVVCSTDSPILWQVCLLSASRQQGSVVVQDLLLEVVQDCTFLLEEILDSADVPEVRKVACQLLHGVEELRGLLVVPRAAGGPELLQRGDQHHKPFQGGDGEGEVPLGEVKFLDFSAHLLHQFLTLLGFRFDGAYPLEELPHGPLSFVQICSGAPTCGSLPSDG